MGGFESGQWYRAPHDRKRIVEESLSLSMKTFRGRIHSSASGRLQWVWTPQNRSEVLYEVARDLDGPVILIAYYAYGEPTAMRINLQSTPTQFGGERWWFSCPFQKSPDNPPCNRRCGNIYLPLGGERYFGCRQCHNLTYQSSREAHLLERFLARQPERPRLFDPDAPEPEFSNSLDLIE